MLLPTYILILFLLSRLYDPCQGDKNDKSDTDHSKKSDSKGQKEKCDIVGVYTLHTKTGDESRNYSALLISEDILVCRHILHSAKTFVCYHGECVTAKRHRDTGAWTYFKLDVKQKHGIEYYEGSLSRCELRRVEQNPKAKADDEEQFYCSPSYSDGDVIECDGLAYGLVEQKSNDKLATIDDLRKAGGIEDPFGESARNAADRADYEEDEEEYIGSEYDLDLALPHAVPMFSFTILPSFLALVNV